MLAREARKKCATTTTKLARSYHDRSFGYREPRKLKLPDYTPSELENRAQNAALLRYVDSVRQHGHRAAKIDPLDLLQRDEVNALDPARYGLSNPTQAYPVDGILWNTQLPKGHDQTSQPTWQLKDIVSFLREVYVGRIAYEFMHSPSKSERLWFTHMLESGEVTGVLGDEGKKRLWELMARSETFDHFLQAKFPNLKRYGCEGAESMLPALDVLFAAAAKAGIENIILCMPHRGRLSLLTDLLQYSPTALFHKIKGGSEIPPDLGATGDVISHLASSPTLSYDGAAKPVKVSLLQNPSHLEAVNPVALGKTRAKQFALIRDSSPECALGDKVMCVQLHGDAAFTGQGVVMETLGLSNLPHFTTGGSVHIVVNNNIGYTTPASGSRSSFYCSDIGKMINAPVLHVNGDYPEDVARAVEVAFNYRNFFRKDIIIDLMCYRQWGHNELDEPSYTSPAMYKLIRNRASVPKMYEEKLVNEGTMTKEEATTRRAAYKSHLEDCLKAVDGYEPEADMLQRQWQGIVWPTSNEAQHNPETGVERERLLTVGKASVATPEDFNMHPRLQRHVKHRLTGLEKGSGIDWGTAEALAFGSLLLDGYDVRISGQDVGRGTFSQRHAMLVDQETEKVVVPLNTLSQDRRLELANSSLSEMAVLGFEYGVSWERPDILPIWEAQFGDFFNGSQVIIDTFVSSSETKWLKQSGLVMLLPHGLDGAGPEHSSSRIERMLQLTNDRYEEARGNVNMHVTYPTTPAQYFHLLRRQMLRNYRKPLIVAAPKGLLRLPAASSSLEEFGPGTRFKPVLASFGGGKVERIILLTGKLYYDLAKEVVSRGLEERVVLIRLEELCPFPFAELASTLEPFLSSAKEIFWVQEEARNQGGWPHAKACGARILGTVPLDCTPFRACESDKTPTLPNQVTHHSGISAGRRLLAKGFSPFPADEEENERLRTIHTVTQAVLGSNYFGPVDRVLAKPTRDGRRRRVLDIGAGTGSWVRDMAKQFPSVDFFGIDIVAVPPDLQSSSSSGGSLLRTSGLLRNTYDSDDEVAELPNVRFERGDVTMGINHPDGEFDVVHCRNVLTVAVPDYVETIREFTRVLRSSGLLLLAETTVPYTLQDGTAHHPDSALAEFTEAVQSALRVVGMDPEIRLTLESIVRKGPFTHPETREIIIPLGEWPQDPRLRRIGRLGREALEMTLRSLTPLLRQGGYDDGRLSMLLSRIHTELDAEKPGSGSGTALVSTYLWAKKK
ncbi:hypothetical protein FRB99_001011 [Tulasnella sp. 403]|nr:hypothetical protein FRB99_001011 [Tulasnella sp. 403]